MHFAFCCCRSNSSKQIHVSAALAYPLLAHGVWWHQSVRLRRTVFDRRMFTSDVRIPEFWIHISSARHFAYTPASAITRFTVTSFAACDEDYCNLHDRFFRFDTRILIRKRGNITTYNLGGDRCWPEIKADCIRHRRMASMAISATLGVMHKQ